MINFHCTGCFILKWPVLYYHSKPLKNLARFWHDLNYLLSLLVKINHSTNGYNFLKIFWKIFKNRQKQPNPQRYIGIISYKKPFVKKILPIIAWFHTPDNRLISNYRHEKMHKKSDLFRFQKTSENRHTESVPLPFRCASPRKKSGTSKLSRGL